MKTQSWNIEHAVRWPFEAEASDRIDVRALDAPQVTRFTFDELPKDLGLKRRMKLREAREVEAVR